MSIKKILLASAALFAITGNAVAEDYAHSSPAVQGYDVVSYQTNKRPVRGTGHFIAEYDGATYLFSSTQNLETFKGESVALRASLQWLLRVRRFGRQEIYR